MKLVGSWFCSHCYFQLVNF